MKKIILGLLCLFWVIASYAQESGSINVGGDIDTFYPVTWYDGNYANNKQTELHIGRSSIHINSQWRGSMITTFTYHSNNWGNSAQFINAHISGNTGSHDAYQNFVGGWTDVSPGNSSRRILIWLRGGGTTYYYDANTTVTPAVYDGSQNALPFVSPNGVSYNSKTTEEDYVKQMGTVLNKPLHVRSGKSAFMGKLGIGTTNPTEELSVNGNIRAHEIKLETDNWSDFVFEEDYQQMSLEEVEAFIAKHGHLPGLKSAEEYEREGVHMMELNQQLLAKIEELTLYTILQEESLKRKEGEIAEMKKRLDKIEKLMDLARDE